MGTVVAKLWEEDEGEYGDEEGEVPPGANDSSHRYNLDGGIKSGAEGWKEVAREIPSRVGCETMEDASNVLSRAVRRFFVRRGDVLRTLKLFWDIEQESSDDILPPLSISDAPPFGKVQSPRLREEIITQLLLRTDAIPTHNNPILRRRRKELVNRLYSLPA